mgnify:CR=1 FL=1
MDQFYQELRKIQKKERNNATLARVEENFYPKIHEYMDRLKNEAISDPFSKTLSRRSIHPIYAKKSYTIINDVRFLVDYSVFPLGATSFQSVKPRISIPPMICGSVICSPSTVTEISTATSGST